MKRLQVSILALVLIIVACAMAFTALKTASDLWYGALYTFTMVLLLAAVIAARFRRGNEKAFWFGFAVFGWAFFVVGLGPWPGQGVDEGEGMGIALNQNLLTSRAILFLVPHLRITTNEFGAIDRITRNTIGIAHLLVTVTIAVGGGAIAILIRRRRGKLVSVKSLTVLAGLAVTTAFASSMAFARPAAKFFTYSVIGVGDFHVARYSKQLAAMGAPSLSTLAARDRNAIVYRLLWLPSFHHPVCVRIDRTGAEVKLRVKVLDGKGGYDPGQIAIDKGIILSADQVTELDRHLERTAFWTMPTTVRIDGMVHDGDQLIVEGIRQGTYHAVNRVLPDQPFTKLCGAILDLTGLGIRPTWDEYHSTEDQPNK
jgi:hypothetical protein